MPIEINQSVMENAIEIWAGLEMKNERPYIPANGTEGEIFEARWCDTCINDNEDITPPLCCEILTMAYVGKQPKEWIYWENKPICTAYKKRVRESDDDENDLNSRYVRGEYITPEEIDDIYLGY